MTIACAVSLIRPIELLAKMPAGGGASGTAMPGQEPLDLGVCMNILKKAIVFLPVLIMLLIYLVKVTLTHEDSSAGADNSTDISLLLMGNNNNNVSDMLTVSDSVEKRSVILDVLKNGTKPV